MQPPLDGSSRKYSAKNTLWMYGGAKIRLTHAHPRSLPPLAGAGSPTSGARELRHRECCVFCGIIHCSRFSARSLFPFPIGGIPGADRTVLFPFRFPLCIRPDVPIRSDVMHMLCATRTPARERTMPLAGD